MVEAPTPEDKSARKVQAMFGSIAPVYDRLNHLLSLSLDRLWRRSSSRSIPDERPLRVLDLCCGTGDQALSLRRRQHRVVAADFCLPMLALARPKFARTGAPRPQPMAADAMRLPFPDATFEALTISFGIRNVADLGAALSEIRRVLRPGGRLRILEATMPRNRLLGAGYRFYFQRVLPRLGRLLSGHDSAYSYLPGSVAEFPQRNDFTQHLTRAGLEHAHWTEYTFGTVCLYSAQCPLPQETSP